MTTAGPPAGSLRPFIVGLTVPVDIFRRTLLAEIPQAAVVQELSAGRLVIVLPGRLAGRLSALPGVGSVIPDELRRTLPHRQPGDSRD